MVRDPKELAEHHADDLRSFGDFDPGELLDREHIRQVVLHAGEVVDPVGVRDERVERLALSHLLRATVVPADVHNRVDDLLAVELEDDPQ